MKIVVQGIAVLVLLLAVLSGCGKSGGGSSTNTAGGSLVSIAVTPANPTIARSMTNQFTATGAYSDNSTQDITASVAWSSSDVAKATINTSGLATAVAAGTTTIKATDSATGINGSTTLTVTNAVLSSVTVTPPNPSIARNATRQFAAIGTFSDSTTQDISTSVTWGSSSPSVATINASGLATAAAAGTTTIKATDAGTGINGSTTLTVTAAVVTAPTLSVIYVIQTDPYTAYGPTEQFAAVGLYSDGSTTDMTKSVAWSSSTPTVATISSAGLATKAGLGSVTIAAKDPATGTIGSTDVSLPSTTTNFNIKSIAAGGTTAIALLPDGTLWGWGGNTYGQVGDGTSTNQSTPVKVPGLSNVAAIAVGGYHSAAIKLDGTVWAWGDNCCGQLGNGTSDGVATWPLPPHPTPTQVTGFTNAKAVAGALFHTVGLKKDGTVWTWGYNSVGQLGIGNNTDSLVPVQVTSLASVTAVAVGGSFSLALKADGTVWTWGYNPYGQLGNGTTTDSNVPVQVSGLANVTAIAAGGSHALAAKSDGTVWAWGYNATGQIGSALTTTMKSTPVQVSGLTNVTKVAAGGGQSIALKSDTTAWVWGDNASKQLGSAVTGTYSSTPVQYNGLAGVFSIAANFYDIYAVHHSTVTANACGNNTDGQKGNGTAGGAGGCSDVTPGDLWKAAYNADFVSWKNAPLILLFGGGDMVTSLLSGLGVPELVKRNTIYKVRVTDLNPANGKTVVITPQSISSSDESVIRVGIDGTSVETVGTGTATLTITWPDGSTATMPINSLLTGPPR